MFEEDDENLLKGMNNGVGRVGGDTVQPTAITEEHLEAPSRP